MSYDVRSLTLPPGQTISLPFLGTTVAVLAADQAFLIGANDDEPQFITAGLKLSPNGGFSKVRLLNPNGADISVQIGLINGDITDSRLQASGNINVRDPGAGGESFADVIAAVGAITNTDVVAMMQNADDQRVPIRELGASFFAGNSVSTSATTLIAPGSNVNGCIIRHFSFMKAAAWSPSVFVASAAPAAYDDTNKHRLILDASSNEGVHSVLRDPFKIEPGNGLFIISAQSASCRYQGGYDLL